MLKYRALTWTLLIVFVIWGIYSLPPIGFATIMTIFWGLAVWEWTGLLKIEAYLEKFFFIAFIFFFSVAAYLYFPKLCLVAGAAAWCVSLYFIVLFPEIMLFRQAKQQVKLILGVLLLSPCWVGLMLIRSYENGLIYLLFIFSLIWMMDTVGYLVGKPLGRHKLIPVLSPGKSIEGVIGGLVFTFLLSGMVVYSSKVPFKQNFLTFFMLLLVACFSIIGDLFESLLKRQAHVKDSGRLLPGHGGMLDRMDSTLAAVPLYALILPWISVST